LSSLTDSNLTRRPRPENHRNAGQPARLRRSRRAEYQDGEEFAQHKKSAIEGLRNIQPGVKPRNPAIENFKPEEPIDNRSFKRFDESGFIDKLTREYGLKK